jgi:hypothetical protein
MARGRLAACPAAATPARPPRSPTFERKACDRSKHIATSVITSALLNVDQRPDAVPGAILRPAHGLHRLRDHRR